MDSNILEKIKKIKSCYIHSNLSRTSNTIIKKKSYTEEQFQIIKSKLEKNNPKKVEKYVCIEYFHKNLLKREKKSNNTDIIYNYYEIYLNNFELINYNIIISKNKEKEIDPENFPNVNKYDYIGEKNIEEYIFKNIDIIFELYNNSEIFININIKDTEILNENDIKLIEIIMLAK